MDPNRTVLAASDTVGTGIGYIMDKRFRHVPIVDEKGCYPGVFGVSCLLRLVLPQAALMERGLTDISFVSDNLKDLRRGEMTSPPGRIDSTASAPTPRATVTSPNGARMGWMAAATPTIASPLKRLALRLSPACCGDA
jgi:hypothetical protein